MRKSAIFTIAQNEPVFLPLWTDYYSRYFDDSDIYILDHLSNDPKTIQTASKYNHIRVYNNYSFDHSWLKNTVESFQQFLLKSYNYVLFSETDEIIFPNPDHSKLNLRDYINFTTQSIVSAQGYELVHDRVHEPKINLQNPILSQRKWIQPSKTYSKTLLANCPLKWTPGFHEIHNDINQNNIVKDLILLHLHRMDFDLAWEKCEFTTQRNWNPECIKQGAGYQNRISNLSDFEKWFYGDFHDGSLYNPIQIPESFIGKV